MSVGTSRCLLDLLMTKSDLHNRRLCLEFTGLRKEGAIKFARSIRVVDIGLVYAA